MSQQSVFNLLGRKKKWMTAKTKDLINKTLERYSDQVFITPTRISVTDTNRWGYVRKNGSIIYNWQLSALPPGLAEFIIMHEIVHLSYLNHQRGFHNMMVGIIPDYKQREKELKKYLAIEPNFEYKTM